MKVVELSKNEFSEISHGGWNETTPKRFLANFLPFFGFFFATLSGYLSGDRTFFRNLLVTATPNTFPKVLPYKWESYRRTNWRCIAVESVIFKQGGTERGGFAQGEKYDVCARSAERHRTVTQVRLSPLVRGESNCAHQIVRNICVTVRCRCAGGRAPSYRHPQRHVIVVPPG